VGGARDPSPYPVDAVVIEDDTQLVLGSEPVVQEEHAAPSALLERALATPSKRPGTVVVEETSPLRFHVIVHDLNLEPSWREEWVLEGLASLLDEAEVRGVGSLALPVLASLPGQLESLRFCELLATELRRARLSRLGRIWLIVSGNAENARGRLEEIGFAVER
jgi:hypothetical protein